ncbi:chaplin [Streptomyces sp. NPDC059994]|uniref:chaplin n=1 Tax=Streptomyces sp. NPDC059994 TaxID=3347029 RepID=UPI00368544CD
MSALLSPSAPPRPPWQTTGRTTVTATRNHFGSGGTECTTDGTGAHAGGAVYGSPGFLSGNLIQIPLRIPVNICGNSIG